MNDAPQSALHIDPRRLPEDWLTYCEKLKEMSDLATEAQTAALRAERAKKRCYAELWHRISEDPGQYGIKKVTVDAVEQAVERHPLYESACQDWIDALDRRGRALNVAFAWRKKDAAMIEVGGFDRAGFYAQTGAGDPFGGEETNTENDGDDHPDHPTLGEGD
jgi:hypothetical protein